MSRLSIPQVDYNPSVVQDFFDRRQELSAQRRSGESNYPNERRVPVPHRTHSGIVVTPDLGLLNDTAWACRRYLSQSMGLLPARILRDGRFSELVERHSADSILNYRPNPELSPFGLRETLTSWAITHGNGVAEIERDAVGRAVWLWPIEPWRLEIKRFKDTKELAYVCEMGAGQEPVILGSMDVIHIRGFGNGAVGISVMEYAAQTIGWARATEIFGASFFGKGLHFGGVASFKKNLTDEQKDAIASDLESSFGGAANNAKWYVTDGEAEVTRMSATPNESQFVEVMQHQVESVCFVPGTEIVTASGLKAIEDIKPGELVLTHKGRWRCVREVTKSDYVGEVITVQSKGMSKVTATTEHPFFAQEIKPTREHQLTAYHPAEFIPAGKLEVGKRQLDGRRARGKFHALTMPRVEASQFQVDLADFAPENYLEQGEFIKYSNNTKAKWVKRLPEMGYDFGWICGLYAADGSQSESQTVFYLGSHEESTHLDLMRRTNNVFGLNTADYLTQEGSVVRLVIHSKIVAKLFADFGHSAHTKILPSWCLTQSKAFYQGLIDGLVAGDGYEYKNRVGLKTTSQNLAWQTRLLLWSLGLNTSIIQQAQKAWVIGDRTGASRDIFTVEWYPYASDRRGSMGLKKDYVFFNLDRAEKSIYSGPVYNIEVDEDESYVTVGGAVHNCRWFGVPPHKVMHLLRATFSNIEHQSIEVVTDAIAPWALRWEQECSYKLFGQNRERLKVEFDLKGLLRGAYKERQEGLQIQRRNGIINADEWRELEGYGPIGDEAGAVYIIEKNMVPLDQVKEIAMAEINRKGSGRKTQPNQSSTNDNQAVAQILAEADVYLGRELIAAE